MSEHTPTSSRVKQLPEQERFSAIYQQREMQLVINRHRLMIKALQEDIVTLFAQLLTDEQKVLLDKLLVAGTIDSTVPQQLEDIEELQTFHP